MSGEWSGVLQSTIKKFVKGAEDAVMRNRKFMAMSKARANVNYNMSGTDLEWRIRYRRQSMQGMADGDTLTFARQNRLKRASLDWRGYAATDSETKKEKLMNKSAEAIITRYSEITKLLLEDMEENFGDEVYIDGNATGNEKRIHGIESFMGTTGSAVTGTPAMAPSDTYAGLATDLGNYGGTWTGNWPKGKGAAEYDFFSPLILDTTSTLATASGGWSSATQTWAARCAEIVRFGIIHSMKNKTAKAMLDMILMEAEMYRLFLENQTTKERIVVDRGSKAGGLASLGFGDTFNYDGVDITYEFGMASNVAYGFNMDQVDLNSLQGTLFDVTGPSPDIASQSDRFSIDFYGNMRWKPRYFLKIAAYGTNGA